MACVTFDHLNPAAVNSCVGMTQSCIQTKERRKENSWEETESRRGEGSHLDGERKDRKGWRINEQDGGAKRSDREGRVEKYDLVNKYIRQKRDKKSRINTDRK